jgi:hypothetical protein
VTPWPALRLTDSPFEERTDDPKETHPVLNDDSSPIVPLFSVDHGTDGVALAPAVRPWWMNVLSRQRILFQLPDSDRDRLIEVTVQVCTLQDWEEIFREEHPDWPWHRVGPLVVAVGLLV